VKNGSKPAAAPTDGSTVVLPASEAAPTPAVPVTSGNA